MSDANTQAQAYAQLITAPEDLEQHLGCMTSLVNRRAGCAEVVHLLGRQTGKEREGRFGHQAHLHTGHGI